jgi:exodeoxyribonuclease VII small subunit
MAENTQVDVKKLSFERAIEELEGIVKRLEDGKVPLDREDHHRCERPGRRRRPARRAVSPSPKRGKKPTVPIARQCPAIWSSACGLGARERCARTYR